MDSMQIYRDLHIGTAKPTEAERGGVPHHLLDVADPRMPFSVADFRGLADAAIAEIHSRGKLPVLVGGTGLYLNALTLEMDFAQAAGDETIRSRLEREAAGESGKQRLHARLAQIDPTSANRLHENDVRRVIRALEIYEATGKPMSDHAVDFKTKPRGYRPIIAGITMPRERLYARIDRRVESMIAAGWLTEVQRLCQSGIPADGQAMQAIGYRELLRVVQGKAKLQAVVPDIQRATRQYAKRQLTWFRRDARVHWFDRADYNSSEALDAALLAYVRAHLTTGTPSSAEE